MCERLVSDMFFPINNNGCIIHTRMWVLVLFYSVTQKSTLRCFERSPWQHACVCLTLTPLCEGHSVVLRWLVEEPEVGESFSRGLAGLVGEAFLAFSIRFEVLCRSTKDGPSALLVSPSSSLKNGAAFHHKVEKPAWTGQKTCGTNANRLQTW